MNRSGYSDEGWDDEWAHLRAGAWAANVRKTFKGRRGQSFLKELRDAMDALPERCLVANAFEDDGAFCALGTVANKRGVTMPEWDEEDGDYYGIAEEAGAALRISKVLAAEVMNANDDSPRAGETPEQRWARVRKWVEKRIREWPWPTSQSMNRPLG